MANRKAPVEPLLDVDAEERAYSSETYDAMIREVERSPCLRRFGGESYYAYMLRMDQMSVRAAALREQARENWERTKEDLRIRNLNIGGLFSGLSRLHAPRYSPYLNTLTRPFRHYSLDPEFSRVRRTARISARPPRDLFLGRRGEDSSGVPYRDIPESSGYGGRAEEEETERNGEDETEESAEEDIDVDIEEKIEEGAGNEVEEEAPEAQQGAEIDDSDSELEMWEVRKPTPELVVIDDDEGEEDPEEVEEEPFEEEEPIDEDPEEEPEGNPEEVVAIEDSDPESSIIDEGEDFDGSDFGFGG